MSWPDYARGIPLWHGAAFYTLNDTYAAALCTGWRRLAGKGRCVVSDTAVYPEKECFPALDKPDTQAAYLRRLAIRLGCPEDAAEAGVMFHNTEKCVVICAGGWERYDAETREVHFTWERELPTVTPTVRIKALAQAWWVDEAQPCQQ